MELERPDYVVLVVADLDRALAFWCGTLGLPLGHRADAYAQLDTGTPRLSLYERDAMRETLGWETLPPHDPARPSCEIGFKVDDVDGAVGELEDAGVEVVTPPTDRPWGQRTAYVRDPDGHLVELVEQVEEPGRASGGD